MAIRVEVYGQHASAVQDILHGAKSLGIVGVEGCRIAHIYFLSIDPGSAAIERLCTELLVDPVSELACWFNLDATPAHVSDAHHATHSVEVAYRPGVTDVSARELERGIAEIGLPACSVATAVRYELVGDLDREQLCLLARRLLCNETVQHFTLGAIQPQFGVAAAAGDRVAVIPIITLKEEQLSALSRQRLLSLDSAEMRAIQVFYTGIGREPTDVELETLAQTWSEHCVHKTFRALIDFEMFDAQGNIRERAEIDGLLHDYIRAATTAVHAPWLRSAFVDNAGIIAFDDRFDLAFKVETHNHPSALEPFGGANTGIGGVVRDILGVSARPIATTDVLCFGPQDYPQSALPAGILHPQRIATGVIAGIGDYGNKLGLPTASGAVIYHEGYLGNPLVFCGCVGLLPTGSHPTQPHIDDLVVLLGGHTGRDGLHGATFSSAELTHETGEIAGSAVQIGDPITEKGLIELIEVARDETLYNAITDCGAGGLSSAIGEMGAKLGVEVELTTVPLKYPGLMPWEIWLSEAQERMVLALPPQNLERLRALAKLWDVHLSVLGRFTGTGDLVVRHGGNIVAELPMKFLHDGLPRHTMQAVWQESPVFSDATRVTTALRDLNTALLRMLAHPNIASKESIIRRYDHEVRGGTVVRPTTGPELDGPTDAAVLKPLGTWDHDQAFSLSAGINPLIGRLDPYAMAISAIDEAFRNAVAVGADPDRIALLDNFCWGNPTLPDRLGALVRACQGCHDGSVAYHAPFISGKDSLYNEFNGSPIPGTLLISAIGIVPDMHCCPTSDLKKVGNRLYLVGESKPELGGSLLHMLYDVEGGTAPTLPSAPLEMYRSLHRAMRQGIVQACHDLSEGGLAVAMAEMALAGRLGAHITLPESTLTLPEFLFGESNGRFVVEIDAADAAKFEAMLAGHALAHIGMVAGDQRLVIDASSENIVDLTVSDLVHSWKSAHFEPAYGQTM